MRALVVLLAAGACGRFGFDARGAPGDGAISDGDGGDGSGAPPAFVAPWHSGPRLRARVLLGGGDPIFYGWHDSLTNTDCQPVIAGEGLERCMPFRARADQFYSDAACTQPLALVYRASCGTDSYAIDETAVTAYPIGALYGGPAYTTSGPDCVPQGAPPNTELHTLGAAAPASTWVRSTYHHQLVGGFEHSFNDFDDGATIDIANLVLPSSGCNPIATEVGPVRCRSATPRASLAYADASCTQRVLLWIRTQYDPSSTTQLAVFPPQACDSTYALYDVVADVTAPTYYRSTPSGCASSATPVGAKLYTATQVADPSPMGTIVRGPDRGRIGTFYWNGPDGIAIPVGNFDQQLGTPCTPFNATDGVLRCLPTPAISELASPDATCTAAAVKMAAECFGARPVDGPDYTSCIDQPWAVHALTVPYTTASMRDGTNTCNVIDLPGGTAFDASATGAEIPPATFPQLIESVE